ncbi:Hypothetical_protein [Hexamita inflata]|uniref:Hypothetical_protein n=1 Tax=Hexamita inflata TaxID=28002 RepID=A0ABP1HHN1_9EUKA
MKQVGQQCDNQNECNSLACYIDINDNYIKKCASKQLTCLVSQIQVYVSQESQTCLKKGGYACLSVGDTTCTFKCRQKQGYQSFRCSIQPLDCNEIKTAVILDDGTTECKLNTGQQCSNKLDCATAACYLNLDQDQYLCSVLKDCSIGAKVPYTLGTQIISSICNIPNNYKCPNDDRCQSNTCYSVIKSEIKRCTSLTLTCAVGEIKTLSVSLQDVSCTLDTGESCQTEGNNLTCFSGYCAQLKRKPDILRCISLQSLSVCDSCSADQKCVIDDNSNATCYSRNGIQNCTDDSCANFCIQSQSGPKICSLPCNSLCDQNLCISDLTGFHPKCNKDPGETCDPTIISQCEFSCLEVSTINSGNYICSNQTANCSDKHVGIIIVNTVYCVPNNGAKCTANEQCQSTQCYPVVQTNISRCSSGLISCQYGQISALNSTLTPFCAKIQGETCIQQEECFSNVCVYTNSNNGEYKCAVDVTCGQNEVNIYQDNQTSTCLKTGGETCAQGSQTCAFGCYEYRPESSNKCAVSYEPICDATHVGLIKHSDNDAGCYLLPGENCTQKLVEECKFSCLRDLDADQLKCSSSIPNCPQFQTAVINQNQLFCKLSNGIVCTSNVDCASGACYLEISTQTLKCVSNVITCNLNQVVKSLIFQSAHQLLASFVQLKIIAQAASVLRSETTLIN